MPRKKDVIVPSKKERLTLSQLASYDDILTDALVDHVCERTLGFGYREVPELTPLRFISGLL